MTTAPRFYQSGGQLFADHRPVSLEWANSKINEWFQLSLRAPTKAVAAEYRRQALSLGATVREAERWLRASGPNAAEAYTQKVREMLQRSVEQGERA